MYEKQEKKAYENFWSKLEGFVKDPRHFASKKPWPELKKLKPFIQGKKTLLDLGCGNGRNTLLFKHMDVTGIDFSPSAIKKAKLYGHGKFEVRSVFNLKGKFDVIIDSGLFHHLRAIQHKKYLDNIKKTLNPDGIYYLAVFSRKSNAKYFAPKKRNWIIKRHFCRFFDKKDIEKIFKDFTILKHWEKRKKDSDLYFHCFIIKHKK